MYTCACEYVCVNVRECVHECVYDCTCACTSVCVMCVYAFFKVIVVFALGTCDHALKVKEKPVVCYICKSLQHM